MQVMGRISSNFRPNRAAANTLPDSSTARKRPISSIGHFSVSFIVLPA